MDEANVRTFSQGREANTPPDSRRNLQPSFVLLIFVNGSFVCR